MIPLLRKDFITHEVQLYEARANGADAILLIAAALTDDSLFTDLHTCALSLGLTTLVEVHDEVETERALKIPNIKLIGIKTNRNLATFEVSLETTERLRPMIPSDISVVAESGIVTAKDVERLAKMDIAAGTVFPARVFVIDAGVAGLQAIATARRLGATVEATDTRPVVKEQVESLGARFAGVETAESAEDTSGYAKELSTDFYRKQADLIAERCAAADAVITTALIGGIKAPKLITADMVRAMKPGSVIVDLAAEAGGNCELTQPGKTVVAHGITICGPLNLPAELSWHASTLYSRNLTSFVLAFWKDGQFQLYLEGEIIRDALVTHQGEVRRPAGG